MKTKVLFVLGSMEIGGVQSGIMNFAKYTPQDQIRFDVLVQSKTEGFHEKEFKEYGNVYHIPVLKTNSALLNIALALPNDLIWKIKFNSFLKKHGGYGAVHSKLLYGVAETMKTAKKRGVPVRVAQSHVDKPQKLNPFYSWYYRRNAKRIEKSATVKLAVSPGASELLFDKFGSRIIKKGTGPKRDRFLSFAYIPGITAGCAGFCRRWSWAVRPGRQSCGDTCRARYGPSRTAGFPS